MNGMVGLRAKAVAEWKQINERSELIGWMKQRMGAANQ